MDEVKIPTTAREIRNMSFEEMDAIVAKFEQEKERRRETEIINVTNNIKDSLDRALELGFIITIESEFGTIEYTNEASIRVTR